MSYVRLFFILLAAKSILCDDCFFYDFESDFEYLFTNDKSSLCQFIPSTWSLGNYVDISVQPPHYRSEKFIKPSDAISCTTSQTFAAEATGVIEVKVYMEATSTTDQVTILVNQVIPGGNDAVVATQQLFSMDQNFQNGWHLLSLPLLGTGSYDAYVSNTLKFTFLNNCTEAMLKLITAMFIVVSHIDPSSI